MYCLYIYLYRGLASWPISGATHLVLRKEKLTRVAAPSPRASLGRRTVCGRTEQLSAAGFEALRN